jgi:hypothetical protein
LSFNTFMQDRILQKLDVSIGTDTECSVCGVLLKKEQRITHQVFGFIFFVHGHFQSNLLTARDFHPPRGEKSQVTLIGGDHFVSALKSEAQLCVLPH